MGGRIVLFGATGYTGRLVAAALADRGARPVLAGRSGERLRALAGELGGLDTAVADVGEPAGVRALVERGDVLVSTVGPFARWGSAAVEAAIAAGAWYLDCSGEPQFIRRVFERYGGGAQAAGCGLVTAMGYDYVPGNLAAGLALRQAGERARAVAVGYWVTRTAPRSGPWWSAGTLATLAAGAGEPSFAWRGGRLVTERGAARTRRFAVGSRRLSGISIGASEHFALPRLHPALLEVGVYLGWFGRLSRALQVAGAAGAALRSVPGAGRAQAALGRRLTGGRGGGPGPEERRATGSLVVAEACDGDGAVVARTVLRGANPYDFTAAVLAWAAMRAAGQGMRGTGALGPAAAFGLADLREACDQAGISVDEGGQP